jgi:tetratricopeptide (TPR) repeat protein
VEAPITPICRRLLAAALAAAVTVPGAASGSVGDQAALAAYVHARAYDGPGALEGAAERYAAALALAPHNEVLAGRALNQAIAAGNSELALRAAAVLEKAGKLPLEGRLLLFSDAVKARRWPLAQAQADAIGKDEIFGFIGPILRAWVAQGSGKGDAGALLAVAPANPGLAGYAAEQRPLLLIAQGKKAEALAALAPLLANQAGSDRLREAVAARLARKGARAEALELLDGDSEALAAAREAIRQGKRLPGDEGGPAGGVASLLVRIAIDMHAQGVPDLALSFARIATFLAPDDSEGWMVAAELLAAKGQQASAMAALAHVQASGPFAGAAAERRLSLLVDLGRKEEALEQARAAAARLPSVESWMRLGDLLAQVTRYEAAADAYAKAIAAAGKSEGARPLWTLWLLRGSTLTQAGKWAEGKAALQQAYALAPKQPMVLNFLGYSLLERRENLDEAERLIAEASRLQPDDASITDSLGWAYFVRGKLPAAIELLEKAAKAQPADAAINEHLGDAYYGAGRRYEARYAWRAALVYAEGPTAERLRGKIDTGYAPELAAP